MSSDSPSKNSSDKKVRLQKYIAECGIASRRKAEVLIAQGKVLVNGEVVTTPGTTVLPGVDAVVVDGTSIRVEEKGIVLLNKPVEVVTTMSDPEGRPTVAHYLTKKYRSYFPIGRLDQDTTGLVIFTNDGELAERLSHPRYKFTRVYQARLSGHVSDEALDKIEKGVNLDDGPASAQLEFLGDEADTTLLQVTVKEGRNRLVRRLFDHVGYPVVDLKRISFGPFTLGRLPYGEIRKLTESEYKKFRKTVLDASASSS